MKTETIQRRPIGNQTIRLSSTVKNKQLRVLQDNQNCIFRVETTFGTCDASGNWTVELELIPDNGIQQVRTRQ